MKNLGIIIFLIVILTNIGNCQSYKPFNFEKGIWYCVYITKGGAFGVHHGTYYARDSVKFFCKGDTIINDVLLKNYSMRVIRVHSLFPGLILKAIPEPLEMTL